MTRHGELEVVSGAGAGARLALELWDQLTVGRGAEADLRLDDPSLSREQFMLCVGRDQCLIQELGSKNGTFVNGERLAGTRVLGDGDRIRVGRHELQVALQSVEQRQLFCSACGGLIDLELEDGVDPDASVQSCLVCRYLGAAAEACPFEELLASQEAAPLLVLSRVGPYRLERRLGQGAAGVVYLAVDERRARQVALKLLRPQAEKRARFERFLHEARLIASLHHPSIVRCHDLGHDQGLVYMALEYVEGIDLDVRMREEGPLPLRRALDWGIQLAGALVYAHGKEVIHRDLKPGNLLLDRRGRIKVIDFGIARALDLGGLTSTDGFLGTPQYMAPEQIRDPRSVDRRADVYAAGVILYRLIAGRSPYPHVHTTKELLRLRLSRPPVPLAEQRPDAPEAVCQVVARAMAFEPEERFGSADELAAALQGCLREVGRIS